MPTLPVLYVNESTATAKFLAHIAEFDARRLYLPEGFSSMFEYCVGKVRLSDDAAYRRITAARVARKYHKIFELLAEGKLNLTAVLLLGPHLTRENANALIGAAAGKTKSEIERRLAHRFPRTELLAMVSALPASRVAAQLAPARVGPTCEPDTGELAPARVEPRESEFDARQLAPARVGPTCEPDTDELALARVRPPVRSTKLAPIAQERFEMHLTIGQSTYDKLQYAKELLSHRVPSGDLAEVLDHALDALIAKLERQKFAATDRPQARPRRSTAKRHIPAHVKRAVWQRDQGRCTFTSEAGHRCGARKFLEFDHVDPVARGGRATVHGIRLRCRPHNQHEAERTFGAGFMAEKREAARRATAETRAADAAR